MLFATAQSYHRVCRGFPLRCVMVPNVTNLRGLGDSIDANDPCTLNPNDPVCLAVGNDVPGTCAIDRDCASGQTCNAVSGFCEKSTSNIASNATGAVRSAIDGLKMWMSGGTSAAGPQIKVGQAPGAPVGAAIGKIFTFTGLLTVAALGAASYGGYRLYKKHKRK